MGQDAGGEQARGKGNSSAPATELDVIAGEQASVPGGPCQEPGGPDEASAGESAGRACGSAVGEADSANPGLRRFLPRLASPACPVPEEQGESENGNCQ